ncbi:MAG: phosphatidylglycerophosphatase A [Oligoflexia bacterium]|nr:phosphatidylglycerophosphatase A [Oligoflexia bacterium]
MKNFFAKLFASVFGLGYIPLGPGTWGTLGAYAAWFFMGGFPLFNYLVLLIILTLFSILVSHQAGRAYRVKDSQHIVIDEVCGFFVTMFAIPHSALWGLAGFILFRVFDIWKPFPIRLSEKLPGGIGVVADDVFAGVYACIILNIVSVII